MGYVTNFAVGTAGHQLRKEPLVIIVAPNPEPSDQVTFPHTQGSMLSGDPNGPDVFLAVHAFEVE
jgi:hypothetical protein